MSVTTLEDEATGQLAAAVEQFQAPLLRYAEQILRQQPDEAQDVVQETFLRLHRALAKRTPIKNLSAWLYRVAHNLAMDVHRRADRHNRIEQVLAAEEPQTTPPAINAMTKMEAQKAALEELHKLPEKQRRVLLLKIIQGMTMQEVADVTGCSIATVHYHMTRGLQALNKRLHDNEK